MATEITKDEIQSLFHLNAEEAAAHLGVGLTALKNMCRNNDIPRWPFRRLKRIEQSAIKILVKWRTRNILTLFVIATNTAGRKKHAL